MEGNQQLEAGLGTCGARHALGRRTGGSRRGRGSWRGRGITSRWRKGVEQEQGQELRLAQEQVQEQGVAQEQPFPGPTVNCPRDPLMSGTSLHRGKEAVQ